MFSCFGKKKKKQKSDSSPSKSPVDKKKDSSPLSNNNQTVIPDSTDSTQPLSNHQLPVEESVNVQRAHSLHAAAPVPIEVRGAGNIQKSATLARYDFLRKSDYISTADRWNALKKQYLEPAMQHTSINGEVPSSRSKYQSLPRQFSPPSTVVSPVKFSNWYNDRKVKEEEARQEFHEREERLRKVLEGAAEDDKHSQQEIELAATKIQAGFRGYETRKHMKENNATTKQPEQEKEGPTEEAGETKAEVSADVTTEAKTEESSESKVNETSEIIAEDTSESKVDETSESKVEETSETKVAEIPDTVGEESSDEKVAESSETKVEETPEDNVVVDSSEVKVEETTEVKTEDVVEETTESETKQQDSEDKEQEQADTEAVPATTDETEAFETKKEEEAAAPPPAEEPKKEEEAQPDVDLDDPSLNDAATKIQAGFKGFQARKQVEEMKKEKDDEQQPEDVPQENHEEDSEELEAAATKIQAGFKGYKTRKELDKQQHPEGGESQEENKEMTEEQKETAMDVVAMMSADGTAYRFAKENIRRKVSKRAAKGSLKWLARARVDAQSNNIQDMTSAFVRLLDDNQDELDEEDDDDLPEELSSMMGMMGAMFGDGESAPEGMEDMAEQFFMSILMPIMEQAYKREVQEPMINWLLAEIPIYLEEHPEDESEHKRLESYMEVLKKQLALYDSIPDDSDRLEPLIVFGQELQELGNLPDELSAKKDAWLAENPHLLEALKNSTENIMGNMQQQMMTSMASLEGASGDENCAIL